jgi:hypothetical protein
MISTGIKVLKADVIKQFYNEKILRENGEPLVYQPKSKTFLYEYEGYYYIIGSLDEPASAIIQGSGWILLAISIVFSTSLNWFLIVPSLMVILGRNLDWVMYALGIMALKMYGYRGSYKKVNAKNCVWVMMHGTR